ncbi:hypothetical protein [Ruegeria lacuscaerulensis]|uniref:hypothetical protein n=1 Tax=Ruegeria lacuscaerulensis TaxID=55218 RepID=UPI00147A8E44|nr:hypothetical protein [Ruegeria lacuscaerulensis]
MAENDAHTPGDEASEQSEALILYTRSVGNVEQSTNAEPERKKSQTGAWFAELLMSLIKTSVAFFLAYLLVQSVELDLKRAQFTADAADKLKTYVIDLNSPELANDSEKSKATALALGGFGSVAAYPLVQFIDHGNEFQIGWGKLGLEQAGLITNDATCDVIVRVIDDPTETFKWSTRKAVAEIAGTVGCRDAVGPLTRLGANLTAAGVPSDVQPDFEAAIQTALTQIERANQRAQPWWKVW